MNNDRGKRGSQAISARGNRIASEREDQDSREGTSVPGKKQSRDMMGSQSAGSRNGASLGHEWKFGLKRKKEKKTEHEDGAKMARE